VLHVAYRRINPGLIEVAFATLVRERPDALFIAPDGFFSSRRVQIVTLAAHQPGLRRCLGREL
jgi:hypothetical protein